MRKEGRKEGRVGRLGTCQAVARERKRGEREREASGIRLGLCAGERKKRNAVRE